MSLSTLQFINRFQSGPFIDRQCTLLFHPSNWTAEIRARVLAQSWRPGFLMLGVGQCVGKHFAFQE